jgi:poly-beta-1,6-N-acetyl-D-glucosamine N-deacetylase
MDFWGKEALCNAMRSIAMTLRTPTMREMVFLALRFTFLPCALREILNRRKVTIIVYHAPTPHFFEAHLGVLRRIYNIIPLSVFLEAREAGDFRTLPPKSLIITFDDGHRSNYALKEVLARHNVPVTIFLCSGVIGTRRRFWWQEGNPGLVQRLKAMPDDERLLTLRGMGFEEPKEFEDRRALSLSELRELSTNADLQSHTIFHPILPRCSSAKAQDEIARSKLDLQAVLRREVYALAYPNGEYTERELRLAEKAGYRCALTLDRGFNTEGTPLFRMPRICIMDDAGQHELVVKASGLWGAIKDLLRGGIHRKPSEGECSEVRANRS